MTWLAQKTGPRDPQHHLTHETQNFHSFNPMFPMGMVLNLILELI